MKKHLLKQGIRVITGTKAEEICVIAPQWGMLFDLSRKLRIILPDIPFDAPDISPIKYDHESFVSDSEIAISSIREKCDFKKANCN